MFLHHFTLYYPHLHVSTHYTHYPISDHFQSVGKHVRRFQSQNMLTSVLTKRRSREIISRIYMPIHARLTSAWWAQFMQWWIRFLWYARCCVFVFREMMWNLSEWMAWGGKKTFFGRFLSQHCYDSPFFQWYIIDLFQNEFLMMLNVL